MIHPRLRDFCGDQSLKDQAIRLLKSGVISTSTSFNINSSTGDPSGILNVSFSNASFNINSSTSDSSASSSADKSTAPKPSNILSLYFDKPRAAKPPLDEVQLWLEGDFDSEIIDDDILSFWRRKKKNFQQLLVSLVRY